MAQCLPGQMAWLAAQEQFAKYARQVFRNHRSLATPKRDMIMHLYCHCAVMIGGKSDTTQLCRGSCGMMDHNGKPLEQVELRTHDRLLFDTHGVPLTDYRNYGELLRAVCGAVRGDVRSCL